MPSALTSREVEARVKPLRFKTNTTTVSFTEKAGDQHKMADVSCCKPG